MLKQADGSFACVAESETRFTLGEVIICFHLASCLYIISFDSRLISFFFFFGCVQTKEELLRVLGLQEEQGSSLEFLRRGYKVCSYTIKSYINLSGESNPVCSKTEFQASTWWEEDVEAELSSEWRN